MKRQNKKLLNTTEPDFESNWLIIHIGLEAIHKIINRKFINPKISHNIITCW